MCVFAFVSVCVSLLTEADAGHTEFTDEVYQNETRFPGGEWKPAAEPNTDVVRDKTDKHTHTQITLILRPEDQTLCLFLILKNR